MSPIDRDTARRRLLTRKCELEEASAISVTARRPVELDHASVGRLSRVDGMQHQAMPQAAERNRVVELRRIEEALARVGHGEYGECVLCGEAIADARLELDPAATSCIACARGGGSR